MRQSRRKTLFGAIVAICAARAGSSFAQSGIRYTYDSAGRLSTATYSNGVKIEYRYDAAGNRRELVTSRPPAALQAGNTLQSNERLTQGQFMQSDDGRFRVHFQSDGNFVLYQINGPVLWASYAFSTHPIWAIMQTDGNLVVQDDTFAVVWTSGTGGNYGARLSVQDDGNLVIYSGSTAIWHTNTGGH